MAVLTFFIYRLHHKIPAGSNKRVSAENAFKMKTFLKIKDDTDPNCIIAAAELWQTEQLRTDITFIV